MCLSDPVAQAIHNQFLDDGMVAIQSITNPCVVGVEALIVFEDVVAEIVDSLEAEDRSELIALVGMVEHDVQDDFDACFVKRLYHVSKFIELISNFRSDAVARLWSEKTERAVPPEIVERIAVDESQNFRFIEVANRQKLHCSNTKFPEMWNFFDDPGKSAGMADS